MAKAKKRRRKKNNVSTQIKYELYGIIILVFSVIGLSQVGLVSEALTDMCRIAFGVWWSAIPLYFIYVGLFVMIRRAWPRFWRPKTTGLLLILAGLLIMSHISLFHQLYPSGNYNAQTVFQTTWLNVREGMQPTQASFLIHQIGGGMVGAVLYSLLYYLFDNLGAELIQYTLFAIGLSLITGLSYVEMARRVREWFQGMGKGLAARLHDLKRPEQGMTARELRERKIEQEQDIPFEEEFHEENYNPAKRKKNGALFQQIFGKTSKDSDWSEAQHTADEAEEEIVYSAHDMQAEDETSAWPDPDPEASENTESNALLIHDFNEHFSEQKAEDTSHESALTDETWSEESESPANVHKENESMTEGSVDSDEEAGTEDSLFENADTESNGNSEYHLPSFALLKKPQGGRSGTGSRQFEAANARKLEATLESFGVRAKVLQVVKGPTVTRYEIQPDVGVKVSRIVNLTDDIALALAAKDIRMEAPIPGKSAIGIEVPNTEVSIVTMREVMENSAFHESKSKITVALGRDISGQPIIADLSKMPHLLVAGATGSGKSVCINGIITSILYKAKPDEVKFIMVDPKMVELNMYNGIPHLLAPVVTDPRRASLALKKVVQEMEKRYEMFAESGTRNIEGFNTILRDKGAGQASLLPYIVVILDELADLMMVASSDVEDSITRIAQKARAAGIHLIIATQRPSVNVITGVIKANIPSRIAFGVSSNVDSRTILDMAGAEKLLGRGDMLFLPVGASKPVRVQGAFLSDQEVEAVVHFAKEQEEAEYQEDMVPEVTETVDGPETFEDDLYEQAVQIVIENKQASVSLLQRRLRVGYTRAARLIDTMEAKGVVGPYEGSKPRAVLITEEQWHNELTS